MDFSIEIQHMNSGDALYEACMDENWLEARHHLKLCDDAAIKRHYAEGVTLLHVVALKDQRDFAQELIERHADVNALNLLDNESPIVIATRAGNARMVALLLSEGAEVNLRNHYDGTALYVACWYKRYDIIEMLTAAGADLEAEMRQGYTPLMASVAQDDVKSAQLLVDVLADIEKLSRVAKAKKILPMIKVPQLDERDALRESTMNRLKASLSKRLMPFVHRQILGICIATESLRLPPYVMLWIIDELPGCQHVSHRQKIDLIESIINQSFRKLKRS
jgi:hypothetical protein